MKPKILALYYTQSGQLKDILDSIFSNVIDDIEVDYVQYSTVRQFQFPWKSSEFFDVMSESVELVAEPVQSIPKNIKQKDYDLVVLGYQPWFLSPSIPTTSFLKSNQAQFLKDKPIVTVIGCRNMWLNAQEQVKVMLNNIGANLVGNIVLVDNNPNLVSVLSIIRWAFKGKKEASGALPEAGVQTSDIKAASRFGKHLISGNINNLHSSLLNDDAITLKPGLVILEKRGIKNFRKFAKYIREKGGPMATERQGRVTLFRRLLTVIIFILSPISSFTAWVQLQLQRKSVMKEVNYFKGLDYEPNKL